MKLHKRILSAVAALLVLTSAVDLTQIAQFSLVAAAADVGETVETDGETVDGEGTELGGDEDTEPGDENGEDDKTGDNENGETGETGETGGDETGETGEPGGDETGETGDNKGDGEEEKPGTGGNEEEKPSTGGNESVDNKEVGDEISYGDLKYLITGSNTVTVTGSSADFPPAKLVIPSTVTYGSITYSVTAIAENAFKNYIEFTSVTIPDGVTTIGEAAFQGCSNIATVNIPGSVTSFGDNAFDQCTGIKTVNFGGTRAEWEALTKKYAIGLPEDFTVECSDDNAPEITWSDKQNIPATTITKDTVITLDGDVKLSGTLHVESGNVTIRSNSNAEKLSTITRHEDFKHTMILVDEGATLTIENVIIDGNKENVKANSAIIVNNGDLTVSFCEIKNNNNTSARPRDNENYALDVGGISNGGTLKIISSAIYGNKAGEDEQSNVKNEANAKTSIEGGLILGEIGGSVTMLNLVTKKGTIETNAEGYFIIKNHMYEIVCKNGDFLYADTANLQARVGDSDIDITYRYSFDDPAWMFEVVKPLKKVTWSANALVNGTTITEDTEITLGGNVVLGGTIDIQKGNVTIIGNGHSITRRLGFTDTMFSVSGDASLTINDVTFDGNNKNVTAYSAIIVNNGTLTANNCVFKNNNNAASNARCGGVANNGTLELNNCAAFNNKAGSDAQSNVKSDTGNVTINGGLIVGDVNRAAVLKGNVKKGTIKTKGSFTVTYGTKSVECKNGDVLYAVNDNNLTAKIGDQLYKIDYNDSSSEWVFTAITTWSGNRYVETIPDNAEITLTGDVTLNGTITIENGIVVINGNNHKITRGNNLGDTMFVIGENAIVVIRDVVFDGNKVEAHSAIIVNNGALGVDNCVFTNNQNTAASLFTATSVLNVGGIANFGMLEFRNSSAYGNTAGEDKQSNVKAIDGSTTNIESGLIVGEIDATGKATLKNDMRKGTVSVKAPDYFTVKSGTNMVICKPGDTLYAKSENLTARIGNKDYNIAYNKDNNWVISDTYTITYNLNGGTISGNFANPRTYLHGDKIEFPTLTRSGYTFGGWYSDQSFAHPVGDNLTATGNATFYAKWTANSGTNQPGTSNPGTNQPGTSNPGTNQPGTSNPGTNQPGTSNPGTSQPGISDLINKGVVIGTNAPQGVIVSTLSDLIRYVLTNSDIEALQNKKKIDISLGITNINGSAPQNDRAVIEEFIRTLNDYRLGYLLDLSLYKTVGSDRYIVRETSGELIIRIVVPETLRASGRTFAVVRVHNGAAKFLEDLDTDPNTITIKTDRFSTYAIIYRDQQFGSNSGNPETGNRTHPAIMIAPVASSLTLVVTAKRKKKEEE